MVLRSSRAVNFRAIEMNVRQDQIKIPRVVNLQVYKYPGKRYLSVLMPPSRPPTCHQSAHDRHSVSLSVSSNLERIDHAVRKLLFGPSLEMPACPLAPPNLWEGGWRFYVRAVLLAVPGAMVVVLGFCVIVYVLSCVFARIADIWQWLDTRALRLSPTLRERSQRQLHEERKNVAVKEGEKSPVKWDEEKHRRHKTLLVGFGGASFLTAALSISEFASLRAGFKTMTACKFALKSGRTGVYAFMGLVFLEAFVSELRRE